MHAYLCSVVHTLRILFYASIITNGCFGIMFDGNYVNGIVDDMVLIEIMLSD